MKPAPDWLAKVRPAEPKISRLAGGKVEVDFGEGGRRLTLSRPKWKGWIRGREEVARAIGTFVPNAIKLAAAGKIAGDLGGEASAQVTEAVLALVMNYGNAQEAILGLVLSDGLDDLEAFELLPTLRVAITDFVIPLLELEKNSLTPFTEMSEMMAPGVNGGLKALFKRRGESTLKGGSDESSPSVPAS